MPSAERLLVSLRRDETRASPARGDRFHPLSANALHARGCDGPKVILIIAGTRPECIKLAPIVRALTDHPELSTVLVNSGQHALAVRETLAEFALRSDIELAPLPCLPHL